MTIDTLRADHLGCYGYPRPTSPFIDSLAERGVLFERAITNSATTVPSHASLFTALYPTQHGIRRNGGKLREGVPTMAELLTTAGYETAGFVSAKAHFAPSNLDRGFAVFGDPPGGAHVTRSGEATTGEALAWLGQRESRKPLFLWVHYFDPHTPYEPTEPLASATSEEAEEHARFLREAHHIDAEGFYGGDANMLAIIDAYDGEIRDVDRTLERLYQGLQEKGGGEAIWVVTADHGEGLGNHDWLLHGKEIYNEQVRVPLIFHSTAGRLEPRRTNEIVEHVDLLPTVLSLIGYELPKTENVTTYGASYWPLVAGEIQTLDKAAVFSERRSFKRRKKSSDKTAPEPATRETATVGYDMRDLMRRALDANFEAGEKYALQDKRFKFVLRSAAPDELYDLEADPYETHNLLSDDPRAGQALRRELQARIRKIRTQKPEETLFIDDEAIEGLRALGYVQ